MSHDDDYLRTGEGTFRVRADVLALMMRGAGYAFVFCLAGLVLAMVLVWLAGALPPLSKEQPDPTPLTLHAAPGAMRTA